MRIVLALNMYHYKVHVLNAKFDIDQSNCMVIGDPCFHGVRLQPCSQPKYASTGAAARAGHAGDLIALFNFDCVVINGFDLPFCFLRGTIGL